MIGIKNGELHCTVRLSHGSHGSNAKRTCTGLQPTPGSEEKKLRRIVPTSAGVSGK
jgi:hypothetical protein